MPFTIPSLSITVWCMRGGMIFKVGHILEAKNGALVPITTGVIALVVGLA